MRDTPTMPPALPELRHDAVRLGWEERRAARALADAIDGCPEAREAFRRWEAVRERRMVVEARIAELEVGHAHGKVGDPHDGPALVAGHGGEP